MGRCDQEERDEGAKPWSEACGVHEPNSINGAIHQTARGRAHDI